MAPQGELPEHALVFVDPSERRRLQNRIAQRRYRQRHKESQKLQGLNNAEEADDNVSNPSNMSDSYVNTDINTDVISNANCPTNTNTCTKVSRKKSKQAVQKDGISLLSNPLQLPQSYSMNDGRASWDPGAIGIDERFHDSQTVGTMELEAEERQYRPLPPQTSPEQRREEYEPQTQSHYQAHTHRNEQLHAVRSVPAQQHTYSAASHNDSPYINDQMYLTNHHSQGVSEGEHDGLSPYAESLGQAPSLYMNSSVSGSASPFDASFMDPVLLGSLPPDGSHLKGIRPSMLQQVEDEEKWSTVGSMKGELSSLMSSSQDCVYDTGDSHHVERLEVGNTSIYGGTALHRAVYFGHERVVETLLEGGAYTETRNRQGRTALHLAALSGKHRLMRILLEHGADPQACTDTGQTSLHLVTQKDEQAMAKLLLRAHVLRHQQSHPQGSCYGRANVNAVDDRGWTPLHIASKDGHQGMVKLLVENGADLEKRDLEGSTALHHASVEGRELVVKLLLQLGADISS